MSFPALREGWGELRRRRLERSVARFTVVQPDDEMLTVYAQLRATCQQAGHALGDKVHDGDRWIVATALHLDCALVSHDGLFRNTSGLRLVTAVAL